MAIDDTRYMDTITGLYDLMQLDANLMIGGTYGIKAISKAEPLVEKLFPVIQIFVIGDKTNDIGEADFELGGALGNIYHRIMEVKILVYQHWPYGAEFEYFTGKTLPTGYMYGIYQIAAYVKGFVTQQYNINGEVFHFKWDDTSFVSGEISLLPHAEISANAFYNERL